MTGIAFEDFTPGAVIEAYIARMYAQTRDFVRTQQPAD